MNFDERIKKAKELFGDNVRIIRTVEKKRRKASGKFRRFDAFKYRRHPEMDKSQYFSCMSKRIYRSQSEARNCANLFEQKCNKKLRVYQCEYCGFFHLTSKPIRGYG